MEFIEEDEILPDIEIREFLSIEKILEFHYKMMYLFCKSNDIEIFGKLNISSNNYFIYTYIYKLCDDYRITNELIDFYPNKTTFILNNKKFNSQNI